MNKIAIVVCAAIMVMACTSVPTTGSVVPAPEPLSPVSEEPLVPVIEISPSGEQAQPDTPVVADQVPVIVNRIPSFKIKESVYFTAGVLDEYIVFTWNGANLMSETRYSASDAVLEKSEYRYNGSQPILKTTKVMEDGREQVRSQVTYEYTRGRLQRETLKTGAGVVITTYEYTYNEEGNCTSRIMKNAKGIVAQSAYTYTNGKLTFSENTSAAGDRINSTEYRYDPQGNRISEETRNNSGQVTSVLRAQWQNGLETREELNGADNTPQLRETNVYSANGDMVQKTIENLQGNSVQIVQYEYKLAGQ